MLLLFMPEACAFGTSNTRNDWLSGGGSPWDYMPGPAYGPDYLNPYSVDRPDWDPYAPSNMVVLRMEMVNPSELGLEVKDPARPPAGRAGSVAAINQLYVQSGSILVRDGAVLLGEPIVLLAMVLFAGEFQLYDKRSLVFSRSLASPGWYRISGSRAELLTYHQYIFRAAGRYSNNATVTVDAGGYPVGKSLVGRVVDYTGRPMAGVRIMIIGGEGGTFSIATDDLGYFSMDLSSGRYIVRPILEGYRFDEGEASVWTGTTSTVGTLVGTPE
jgi:hypothetical protein